MNLKQLFYDSNIHLKDKFQSLKKNSGNVVVGQVTIEQVLTGMKGVPSLATETSKLDPEQGIRYRGYSIQELLEQFPKEEGQSVPLPESLLYLFLIGKLPTLAETREVTKLLTEYGEVPPYVYKIIDNMPDTLSPMAQLSIAVSSMTGISRFQQAHLEAVPKDEMWEYAYEDTIKLIACLPHLATYIYGKCIGKKCPLPDKSLDWAANMSYMMGFSSEEVKNLMRFFMILHADHEGGNVSAHATHLVGSALSNPFYAYSAGLNGLAGPLHGRANQEVLAWINNMVKELKTDTPTDEQVIQYVKNTLASKRVVPGYGHAVLRIADPRFTAQLKFANDNIHDDPLVDIVKQLYRVVPGTLNQVAKIKNPWPNVDAISGSLLKHYGITWEPFYTVMFGVSRSIGVLSSLLIDRLVGMPIERPTSHLVSWFEEKAKENS